MSLDNKDRLEALHAAEIETHLIVSAGATALSTSYPAAGIAIGPNVATDSTAKPLPSGGARLDGLFLRLDTIAGGATTVTYYLSYTSTGSYVLTDAITSTILPAPSAVTEGGVAALIDIPYRALYTGAGAILGVAGTLYLFAKLNAGTVNCTARLTYRANHPYPRTQYLPTL